MVSQQKPKKDEILAGINNQKIIVNQRLQDIAVAVNGIFQMVDMYVNATEDKKLPNKEEKNKK